MDCKEFRNNLFAFTEGTLLPAADTAFRLHAASCGECSHILAEFRATVQQLESARLAEPPAFAEARLLQRLEEYVALPQAALWPQPMRLSRLIYLSLGAAAAILLGVMLGFTGEKKLPLRNASDPMMDMRTELNVPAIAEEDVIQFSHQ
jgi:anti-sigma factor RsiW